MWGWSNFTGVFCDCLLITTIQTKTFWWEQPSRARLNCFADAGYAIMPPWSKRTSLKFGTCLRVMTIGVDFSKRTCVGCTWEQLQSSSELKDPKVHSHWLLLIQTRPGFWKRLIKRARKKLYSSATEATSFTPTSCSGLWRSEAHSPGRALYSTSE